jgi:hypothetical protein
VDDEDGVEEVVRGPGGRGRRSLRHSARVRSNRHPAVACTTDIGIGLNVVQTVGEGDGCEGTPSSVSCCRRQRPLPSLEEAGYGDPRRRLPNTWTCGGRCSLLQRERYGASFVSINTYGRNQDHTLQGRSSQIGSKELRRLKLRPEAEKKWRIRFLRAALILGFPGQTLLERRPKMAPNAQQCEPKNPCPAR